jgi:hypothetical protein
MACGYFNDAYNIETIHNRTARWPMNWKRFLGKQLWTNRGIIPAFVWLDWRKARKNSEHQVSMPGFEQSICRIKVRKIASISPSLVYLLVLQAEFQTLTGLLEASKCGAVVIKWAVTLSAVICNYCGNFSSISIQYNLYFIWSSNGTSSL